MHSIVHVRHNSTLAIRKTSKPALPRLPVPDLQKTLERYLKSLEPFLLEDAARGGVPFNEALALRAKWADTFCTGVGKKCQERLMELDQNSPHNWLDDNFWLKMYHEWRAPLLINSNWWLAFHDDDQYTGPPVVGPGPTEWQVKRAAWLVHRTLQFRDKQETYPNATRTGIWLQENVLKMFNRARIPKRNCDTLSHIIPLSDPTAQNIIVMVNNWFYSLRVYEAPSINTGPVLCQPGIILSRLQAIAHDAARSAPGPPIGALSSDSRDLWASNLEHLLSLSPRNREIHQTIVNSLLCLSLDSEIHTTQSPGSSILPSPSGITQQTLDSHLHYIRSVPSNVANRFFDKPYSLIVDPSGRAGAMGEHSPVDALVPSIVAEYSLVQGVEEGFGVVPPESHSPEWSRLEWDTDDRITCACAVSYENALRLMADSDDSVLWFEQYGSDWIKGEAGLSPDAYIQMAFQLAWYRTMGYFTATYETALTRMFNKGRTETIRTLSTDSRAFVLGMDDPHITVESKYLLLKRAIQTHTGLTREAATGRGIDRHLLGLRKMLQGNESAELFEDPMFGRSQEWHLSTSGLSAGELFRGTGFGTTYEDGYGINYLAAPGMIKFGIESKVSNSATSTEGFKIALTDAMNDMKSICSNVRPTTSKL